jgi:hypothetical protein
MNLIYIFIALQVLDAVSTVIALDGGGHEVNPILKKIMDKIGVIPALVLVKGAAIAFFWYYQELLPDPLVLLLCLGYVWILYNNIQVIRENL